jgi:hypothetical protein
LKPWQGAAHVLVTVTAVALARFAVFDVVQWAMLGRPHEGVLLGALLIVTAAALAPLVTTCYSHNQVSSNVISLHCARFAECCAPLSFALSACAAGHLPAAHNAASIDGAAASVCYVCSGDV